MKKKKKIIFEVTGRTQDSMCVEVKIYGTARSIWMEQWEFDDKVNMAFNDGYDITIFDEEL